MQKKNFVWIALVTMACLLPQCGKRNESVIFTEEKATGITPTQEQIPKGELDFEVKNGTNKTVYITSFTYIQKEPTVRWRWDKSPVYKLNPNESVFINIDTIPDQRNREGIFGYLSVFDQEEDAHDAIFELLDDTKKIDLGRLYELHGKCVTLSIEKYGFKAEKLDFSIREKIKKKHLTPELDFIVENNTGQTIFVTGFVYQIEENSRSTWHYDKTPVQKLEPGDVSIINVDTISEARDRRYMLGYLGVFGKNQEKEAHDATYELLHTKNKVTLGNLANLKNKKVIIEIEEYGSVGEIVEFKVAKKSTKRPTPLATAPPATPLTDQEKEISKTVEKRENKKVYRLFTQNKRREE